MTSFRNDDPDNPEVKSIYDDDKVLTYTLTNEYLPGFTRTVLMVCDIHNGSLVIATGPGARKMFQALMENKDPITIP